MGDKYEPLDGETNGMETSGEPDTTSHRQTGKQMNWPDTTSHQPDWETNGFLDGETNELETSGSERIGNPNSELFGEKCVTRPGFFQTNIYLQWRQDKCFQLLGHF
jgi:hypothetical protein